MLEVVEVCGLLNNVRAANLATRYMQVLPGLTDLKPSALQGTEARGQL